MNLEELKRKVKVLEDTEAIKNMHRDYIFWLRNSQFDEMIDCFAENATAEIRTFGPRTGRDTIARLFKEEIAKVKIPRGHSLVQPVITVEGDKAKGHWTMYTFNYDYTAPAGMGRLIECEQGRYDCEYVREAGKWKFSYLKWICPWPEQQGPS